MISRGIRAMRRFFSVTPENEMGKKVYKICITGGPCSGKTTVMNYLKEKFEPQFLVYSLPEVATMLVTSGVNIIPNQFTEDEHFKFTVRQSVIPGKIRAFPVSDGGLLYFNCSRRGERRDPLD